MDTDIVTASRAVSLWFPTGLPGFPDARRFVLDPAGGDGGAPRCAADGPDGPGGAVGPFHVLRCGDAGVGELSFLVVDPDAFFPDYEVELDEEVCTRLGIDDESDAAALLIVTVHGDAHAATANLLGPIVLNRRTQLAAQVVMAGSGHDVRTRLA